MPQSLSKNYIHIVFSTKHREAFIDDSIESHLFAYLSRTCQSLECQPIKIGGYVDHVHILCMLSRKIAVMKLVEEVKKQSSKWMKSQGKAYHHFYWQRGYAVFSVGYRNIDKAINYIASQKEHHQSRSFEKEYIQLLNQYEIAYDERYVWD